MKSKKVNADVFSAWLSAMDWDRHGGIAQCAEALGRSPMQISRYRAGAPLSRELRLAMTALAQGLGPWDPKTDGLPAVHLSVSFGKADSP